MKTITRALLCILLVFSLTLSFAGCVSRNEAKSYTNSFLDALEVGDYDAAEALLHPEKTFDVAQYALTLKETRGLDFLSGVNVDRYTNFSTAAYESAVGGSSYKLAMEVTIGQTQVKMTLTVVENDSGMGIYDFAFT